MWLTVSPLQTAGSNGFKSIYLVAGSEGLFNHKAVSGPQIHPKSYQLQQIAH